MSAVASQSQGFKAKDPPSDPRQDLLEALRLGVASIIVMLIVGFLLSGVVGPLFALGSVEETVTDILTRLSLLILPYIAYISAASVARRHAETSIAKALGLAFASTSLLFALVSAGHFALDYGPFSPRSSLQMTLSQVDAGIRIDAMAPGGAAESAELQVGDVITAIRRDPVDLAAFNKRVSQAEEGDPLRLRFTRGDEELQKTTRVVLVSSDNLDALLPGFVFALVFTAVILFLPGHWGALHRAGRLADTAADRLLLGHHRHILLPHRRPRAVGWQ